MRPLFISCLYIDAFRNPIVTAVTMRYGFFRELEKSAPLLPLLAIGTYLVFSPIWSPSVAPRMYDNARALEIILLVLSSLAFLIPALSSEAIKLWRGLPTFARGLMATFLLGGAISAAMSGVVQMGIMQMSLVTQLVLLFLLTASAVRTAGRTAEVILSVGITTGAALLVFGFWLSFIQSYAEGTPFSWVSPFLEFANVRFFGQYQAYALLMVCLPVMLLRASRSWRAIVYIVAANFWALQWMVGSRAVWVGFIAAMAMISLYMRSGRTRWLLTQASLVVAGGIIFWVFSITVLATSNATPIPVANSILERGEESSSERITLAKAALGMIASHPLAGVGPGQFGLHYDATNAAHPHDTPLQLVSEYGLIAGGAGVALGAILVVFAVLQVRRDAVRESNATTATLAAASLMGLVDSLFSGNLVMPHSQVLFSVLAGWLVGRSTLGDRPIWLSARIGQEKVALVGIAVLACVTTTVLAIAYLDVIRDMPYPPSLRIPSFWQYGRFTDW